MDVKIIPIAPYWDNLQDYHRRHNPDDLDFWDWIKQEYGAYQVYIKPTPRADGEKDSCGLMFSDEDDAVMFTLKWI
jgi:hypothetical protein